jgi:antitoxin ParD1/3/4
LEEDERKIAFLRAAIQEGIDSGICEDFDPEEHLKQLKATYHNG